MLCMTGKRRRPSVDHAVHDRGILAGGACTTDSDAVKNVQAREHGPGVAELKTVVFSHKIGSETGASVRDTEIWENPGKKRAHHVDSSDSFSNVDRVGGRRDRKERM